MKAKYSIVLIMLGVILQFIAGMIKVLHWKGGDMMVLSSTVIIVLGIALLAYKIITYKRFKDFLNS